MTEHNLTSELQSLLADYHRLALLCDSIRLDAYSVKVVDSFHYPVLVSYLAVEKAKVRSLAEAFAVLFVRELYQNNEWETSQLWSPWAEALELVWLPGYFGSPGDNGPSSCCIRKLETAFFLEEIGVCMRHNHLSEREIADFYAVHRDADVAEVRRVYAGYNCFGETKDQYFAAEFGCGYD